MHESRTAVAAGQPVIVRDERWTVIGADRFDDVTLVSLRGMEVNNRDELTAVLTSADRIRPSPLHTRLRQRSRRAVLAAVASAAADAASWNQCWTAGHARLELPAWQIEPAAAAVGGAMRILLADDVGLGKTIQAALIVAELRARRLAERVLVLTPASIREQWAGELRDRFGFTPAVFDHSALATRAATLPPGVNPWKTTPLVISSIDLVKRPEVRTALESVPFDVLIVDEAHHVTPGTDRAAVVAELASRTPWVVLATATPHGGDDAAFQFLQRLGDVGTEPLRTFRRSRRGVSGATARRSRLFFVRPTREERLLLEATTRYARALAGGQAHPGARLVASVIARRAASSAGAVHGTLTRRLALLTKTAEPERQTRLPWEEHDEDEVADAVLGGPGLRDSVHEVAWLRRLADLAQAAAARSSKVGVIRRLLRRTHEQVLVFSEFRDVARLVAAALADLCAVATLHGGLSSRERRDAVGAFNNGHIRVLVATDAASEGLNLQARCRLVVNVELPWTPRRLEQRIGRLDRLGQRRRVHAMQLAHRGSYEGTVIVRLERRRAHALRATGDTGRDVDTAALLCRPRRSPASVAEEARGPGAVYASRARGSGSRVRLAYLVTLVDGGGQLVQRRVEARQIEWTNAPGRRFTRSAVRQLAGHAAVRRTFTPQLSQLAEAARAATGAAAGAIDGRLTAIVSHLDARSRTAPWQASLFDRRAEQQAVARRNSIAELQRHLRHRSTAVQSLTHVTALTPELIAAWVE